MSRSSAQLEELRALRRQLIYMLAVALALAALSLAEAVVARWLEPLVPPWALESALLAAFIALALALAYLVARVVLRLGGLVTSSLERRPALRSLVPLVRASFAVAALVAFLVVSLRVLAYRVAAVAGVVEQLSQALSGFLSTLIALILALQVREVVGNYIAWAIIKAAGLVEQGDYVSFGGEVLKVVRIGYSHTVMVSNLNEEVYVPNMRFLLETFRKGFSRAVRMFVSVRFTLPYSLPLDRVREGVANAIERYAQRYDSVGVAEYRLLIYDLSPYTVTYELWVKPARPTFPIALRSAIMGELLREFGEALSAPVLLRLVGGEAGSGGASAGDPPSKR